MGRFTPVSFWPTLDPGGKRGIETLCHHHDVQEHRQEKSVGLNHLPSKIDVVE
ncbi:hypothetical protein ACQ0MK_06240 [Thalassospira lucentensis]|uniref:hypothetical protein n=1 Tax=Thalassospira lucentensis TaxID=168935 RepID=UPI003D2EC453